MPRPHHSLLLLELLAYTFRNRPEAIVEKILDRRPISCCVRERKLGGVILVSARQPAKEIMVSVLLFYERSFPSLGSACLVLSLKLSKFLTNVYQCTWHSRWGDDLLQDVVGGLNEKPVTDATHYIARRRRLNINELGKKTRSLPRP